MEDLTIPINVHVSYAHALSEYLYLPEQSYEKKALFLPH